MTATTMPLPEPRCVGCGKRPDELAEYSRAETGSRLSPDDYVRREEGTYNRANGHFACTECYSDMGMPSRPYPDRWVAP